jgi:hypothetical protein
MPNGFPCPNPSCGQVFSPEEVRNAARLVCPRCGTVFQFRPTPPGAPPPTVPPLPARPSPAKAPPALPTRPARRVPPPPRVEDLPEVLPVVERRPPPPVVAPVRPAVPVARPVAPAPPAGLEFEEPREVVTAPVRGRRGRGVGRVLLFVFLGLVCVGLAGGGVWWMRYYMGQEEGDLGFYPRLGNFRFRPPEGWQRDEDAQRRMGVSLLMRRTNPRCELAVAYRDYKTRSPSKAEMLDEALKRLRAYFRAPEYNDPFAPDAGESTGRLGGAPAQVVEFQGEDPEGVEMTGECYFLTRRGYAYWVFTWGPAGEGREALAEHWDRARAGFRLLEGREGWQERPRETAPLDGTLIPYRLRYPRDVWQTEESPRDYDPKAEHALRAFEPVFDERTGRKTLVESPGRLATVLVLVLPRAEGLKSAVEAARAHVQKQQQDAYPRTKVGLLKDPKTGAPALDRDTDVGAFRGHVSKLQIDNDTERKRYGLLAVVNCPEGVLVLFGECPLDRRDFWDQEFKALVSTLRARAGGR